ncbi:hypothetical protein [Aureimonas sp. ME7]|uniref:hypothetical protein n=1 Tax=Aureimonas sp. ME7 TaxID=2744252 RepID=UPI0015F3D872|nr:hypothetical protein [Aureimonas sp. ME7]
MPLDGGVLLSERESPKLRLFCRKCGLRRQYDNEALIARFGDAQVPRLISELARLNGCQRAHKGDINDFCGLRGRTTDDPEWIASRPAP